MKLKVRVPLRIDFAGGTTDLEPVVNQVGGAVLNAAINKYVIGETDSNSDRTYLRYSVSAPSGAGLGTSAAMNVCWMSLTSHIKDKMKLAQKVFRLEKLKGELNGMQDQLACCFGGINLWRFEKGMKIKREKINTDNRIIDHLYLMYPGSKHNSTIANRGYLENHKFKIFEKIKNNAIKASEYLKKYDLKRLGKSMTKDWLLHKKLLNVKQTETDRIIERIKKLHRIYGAKPLGAGKGCILFLTKYRILTNRINFRFDGNGLCHL